MRIFLLIISFVFYSTYSNALVRLKTSDFQQLIRKNKSTTIVVFWASYCPYCKKEIKELYKNKTELDKKQISVILISIDKLESSALRAYKNLNVDFPLYIATNNLINYLNIRLVPIIAIYDKNGNMHDIAPGYKTFTEILKMLKD
ncbi:redoxin domain-containing protein [Deferribacter autotrophicus]|uniref:Redoxin domain-containing protein n=1 Tax=Deferribacter autotrophicus TaxID=500465 RepID=A0A5A8F5G0_9BACT|nr:TlpA family protein disulfide reductase [Deferribacter autotrophicus]KAA0258930.1 redoxin domain-containing protein [Deferribacter autotrophicus]